MGVASLILGIIGIISCIIVVIAPIGLVAVIVGLILGIVEVVKKGKTGEKRGLGIAGIIICAIMTVVLIIESIVMVLGLSIYNSTQKSLIDKANEVARNNVGQNSTNTLNSGNTAQNNNNSLQSQEVKIFNSRFETYVGQKTGTVVRSLLSSVQSSNSIYTDKIISCTLDGGVSEDVSTLRTKIEPTSNYNVTLGYDVQGYVNKVNIYTNSR